MLVRELHLLVLFHARHALLVPVVLLQNLGVVQHYLRLACRVVVVCRDELGLGNVGVLVLLVGKVSHQGNRRFEPLLFLSFIGPLEFMVLDL